MGFIIAADEVGRGCLAGPLVVGAVLVPEDMDRITGVNDSKKLSPAARQKVSTTLLSTDDVTATTYWVHASDIDSGGMTRALTTAFLGAVNTLLSQMKDRGQVVEVRIDGSTMPSIGFGRIPVKFIVKGDALDWRIGAASIIAKVTRDTWMEEQHPDHPEYRWDSNKGYGSKDHTDAIRKHGLTSLHRATFCRRFVPVAPPADDDDLDFLLNGL